MKNLSFHNPKQQLPQKGRSVLLKINHNILYEDGYIFDGINFRRYVFPILGKIIPKDTIVGWAYLADFAHR